MDSKIVWWLIIYAVGVLCMLIVFTNFGDLAIDRLYKRRKDVKDEVEIRKEIDGPK